MDKEAVVARLRLSRMREDMGSTYAAGFTLGKLWAEAAASVTDLENALDFTVRECGNSITGFDQQCATPSSRSNRGLTIFKRLFNSDATAEESESFWMVHIDRLKQIGGFGDTPRTNEFYWGFLVGASELWQEFRAEVPNYKPINSSRKEDPPR